MRFTILISAIMVATAINKNFTDDFGLIPIACAGIYALIQDASEAIKKK